MAIGLVLGLTLAEIVLRAAGISYPLPYQTDDFCGSRLRPGLIARFSKEGGALVRINRAGFRDRDHAIAKPPGTIRIAVLGDSFAEALQVAQEDTFWWRLEQELGSRGVFRGQPIEVLNFGISGYGTAQQLEQWRHCVRAYDPDVVLLAFYAGNDIRNNSPRLETYRVRPFFHIEDGQLALDAGFRRHPDFLKAKSSWVRAKVAVINRSRLLQLLNELWNRIRMRTPKPDAVSGVEDSEVFLPPADENWRDAWAITERIIQQLNAEVTQCGSAFVLVAVTLDIQVHPDASVREQFRKDIGASDLTYPDQRLGALGERCGFPVILLSEAMRRYAEQSRQPLHGFPNSGLGVGHWNATGHHLAARLIAEAMSQAPAGTWDHANAGPHLTIWQDEDGPWSVPAISYGTSSSVSSLWEAWRMARTKTMSGRIVNTARCVERPPRP